MQICQQGVTRPTHRTQCSSGAGIEKDTCVKDMDKQLEGVLGLLFQALGVDGHEGAVVAGPVLVQGRALGTQLGRALDGARHVAGKGARRLLFFGPPARRARQAEWHLGRGVGQSAKGIQGEDRCVW